MIQVGTIQSELLHSPSLQPLQFTLTKCSKTSLKLSYLVNTGVDFEYALTTDSYDSNKKRSFLAVSFMIPPSNPSHV